MRSTELFNQQLNRVRTGDHGSGHILLLSHSDRQIIMLGDQGCSIQILKIKSVTQKQPEVYQRTYNKNSGEKLGDFYRNPELIWQSCLDAISVNITTHYYLLLSY